MDDFCVQFYLTEGKTYDILLNNRKGIFITLERRLAMNLAKKVLTFLVIIASAALNAVNYTLFIIPNNFAPSGINGICAMFQHITGQSMGYLSLLLNIPFAIAIYFLVRKTLAVRSMVYVLVFSGLLVVFKESPVFASIAYSTTSSTILGPIVGAILSGFLCGLLMKAGGLAGGSDFIASLVHRFRPDFNFFWTGFAVNVCVACASFFVYRNGLEPVLLCIVYSFVCSTVMDKFNKSGRSAVRYEIITDQPEELSRQIIEKLHHSATLIPAKGMYQGKQTNLLICVINKTQVTAFADILAEFPNTFGISNQVSQVLGNFKRLDHSGKLPPQLLDVGDGTGIRS